MFGGSTILSVLKWGAIALGTISGLWALLARKPTQEDEHGRKQLTSSGYVTLAILIGSALISATSFGFETLAKQQEKVQNQLEKTEAARLAHESRERERVRDQNILITQFNTRAIQAEQRAAVSEQRASAADQRATAFALAAEDRLRAMALTRDVSIGASRNLARTGVALGELERLLGPLEPLVVEFTWEIPRGAPGLNAWGARVLPRIREEDAATREALARYNRTGRIFEPMRVKKVVPSDDIYPAYRSPGEEVRLFAYLSTLYMSLEFRAPASSAKGVMRKPKAEQGRADLSFGLGEEKPDITYVVATGALLVTIRRAIPLEEMPRTGAIVSYSDLERSLFVIELRGNGVGEAIVPWAVPLRGELVGRTRGYEFCPGDFRRNLSKPELAVYAVSNVAPSVETSAFPTKCDPIRSAEQGY